MAKVPYAIEILPKISTAWVGRTNVTDDRQTDGRAIAYSELEREFTFAKKHMQNFPYMVRPVFSWITTYKTTSISLMYLVIVSNIWHWKATFVFIMVALCNRADHYIFALWFLFSSFFPRLISAAVDWMSTILPAHMVWPLISANLKCMSEMCCTWLAENTGHKKSPFWHHRTNLSGCIFAVEACIDNREKSLLTTISPPHVLIIWWTLTY